MKVTDIKIEKIGLFHFYLVDKMTGETTFIEFKNVPKDIAINLINQHIESFNLVDAVQSVDIIDTSNISTWIDIETDMHLLRFYLFKN